MKYRWEHGANYNIGYTVLDAGTWPYLAKI